MSDKASKLLSTVVTLMICCRPLLVLASLNLSCPEIDSTPDPSLPSLALPIFNGIMWQDDDLSHNYPQLNGTVLVDISHDKSLFDYCSVASYTPNGIQSLLR
jgi:hypothetical protein